MQVRLWEPDDTDTVVGWIEKDPQIVQAFGLTPPVPAEEAVMAITRGILSGKWAFGVVEDKELRPVAVVALVGVVENAGQVHIATNPDRPMQSIKAAITGVEFVFENLQGIETLLTVLPASYERWAEVLDKHLGFKKANNIMMSLKREGFNGCRNRSRHSVST
jgi:hypothetical protein